MNPATYHPFRHRLRTAGCAVLVLVAVGSAAAGSSNGRRSSSEHGLGAGPAGHQVDFDRDGYPDAAFVVKGAGVGTHDYGPITVFRGGKDGLRPTGRPLFPGGSHRDRKGPPEEGYANPIPGDFDGDGYTDLVVHRYVPAARNEDSPLAGSYPVLLWGGPGGLGHPVRLAVPGKGRDNPFVASAAGDVDGDGSLDLVQASMYEDSGAPGRVAYGPVSRSGKPAGVRKFGPRGGRTAVVADFNRDRRADILVCTDYDEEYEDGPPATPVQYYRGTSDGPVRDDRFTRQLARNIGLTQGTRIRAGTDLDGDGYPDILPPGQSGKPYRTYLRGGPEGLRREEWRLEVEAQVGTPLLAGDITGDGKAEFVSTISHGKHHNRRRIQVAARKAGPRQLPVQGIDLDSPGVPGDSFVSDIGKRDRFAEELQLLDADRDGHMDVLAGETFGGLPSHRFGGFWYFRGGKDGLRTDDVHRFALSDLGVSPAT